MTKMIMSDGIDSGWILRRKIILWWKNLMATSNNNEPNKDYYSEKK